MNKVILMGRLTRDPEIRYSSGENQQLQDTHLQSIVDSDVREMSRQQTLLTVSFLAEVQSSLRIIFIRVPRLWQPDGFRQEAIPIRKATVFIRPM